MECQEWLTKDVRISRLDTDTAIERDHRCRYHSRQLAACGQTPDGRPDTGHWTELWAVSRQLACPCSISRHAHRCVHASPWSVSHQSAGSVTAALIIGRFLTHRAQHGLYVHGHEAVDWLTTRSAAGRDACVCVAYVTPIHSLPAPLAADTETRVACSCCSLRAMFNPLFNLIECRKKGPRKIGPLGKNGHGKWRRRKNRPHIS